MQGPAAGMLYGRGKGVQSSTQQPAEVSSPATAAAAQQCSLERPAKRCAQALPTCSPATMLTACRVSPECQGVSAAVMLGATENKLSQQAA